MRWPRPRITVRRLLVLVATVAVALGIAREFDEGLPPRFVIRDIPRRVERLRPGMRREQVYEILGFGRSWLRGGLGAIGEARGFGNQNARRETYEVRASRYSRGKAVRAGDLHLWQPSAVFYLSFRSESNSPSWSNEEFPLLIWAEFCSDGRTIAEMPRPPRARP